MSRARTRQRQAARTAHRQAAWKQRVIVPFGGVSALVPLPIARRLGYDHELSSRIAGAADHYAKVNRL